MPPPFVKFVLRKEAHRKLALQRGVYESTLQTGTRYWAGYDLIIMNTQSLLAHLPGHGAHLFMWQLTLGEHSSALYLLPLPPSPDPKCSASETALPWRSDLAFTARALVILGGGSPCQDYRNELTGGQGPRKLTVPK